MTRHLELVRFRVRNKVGVRVSRLLQPVSEDHLAALATTLQSI